MTIFAASTDDSETNTRFAKELAVHYPILADPTHQAAQAMGVLTERGYAQRWTFVVGRDGKLLDIEKKVDVKHAGSQLVKILTRLGVARKNPPPPEEPTSRPGKGD